MESDEDESSMAALMDSVGALNIQDSEVLRIAFRYLPLDCLKTCRLVNKTFHEAATKWLLSRSRVRLDSVNKFQRYIQEAPSMQTIWANYSIPINNKITAELLSDFGHLFGSSVLALELEIKHRDTNLTYLEDLISLQLPNLEELTLKGKFPATAMFQNPTRMVGKLDKLKLFNIFAKGWHRLPPNQSGEVTFKSPVIGQLLTAMPNLQMINYFPDVDSPRDAHKHYSSFLYNLTELDTVILNQLTEIQNFTFSFSEIFSLEKFAAKGIPLQKMHVMVEDEWQPQVLRLFLETFRTSLTHLILRNATENPIDWPRLLKLEELTLIGVNVHGTDFLANFPALRSLKISQDRVTTVDLTPERCLPVPHTITSLKIIETGPVTASEAYRLSNNGLAVLFKDLPFLVELAIIQNINSTRPTFTDEGVTGSKLSLTSPELAIPSRDFRVVNRNLVRFNHFIGSLADLRKLTLRAPKITDVSLMCGVVNCQKLAELDIASPKISEAACVELLNYVRVSKLRIQDFGSFTSSGKSEILMRMKFQEVFHA
ncbi:hypothetical protein Ocin01_14455 [Orchesella cincta]|uniref:F-box domain-containing protein n=1 Tax=Orchesella cincta TaxID=48709 RepID=A0A1D2MGX2_ORCCI|nr:hypothetical protein Ocin01_14455 [Orchesella cincta]